MGWLLFQCLSVCAAFQLYWRNDWICSRWIVTVLLESFTTLKLVVPLEPLNNVLIISVEMKAEQQCLYNQDLQNQLSIHIFNNCDHKCFKTLYSGKISVATKQCLEKLANIQILSFIFFIEKSDKGSIFAQQLLSLFFYKSLNKQVLTLPSRLC